MGKETFRFELKAVIYKISFLNCTKFHIFTKKKTKQNKTKQEQKKKKKKKALCKYNGNFLDQPLLLY